MIRDPHDSQPLNWKVQTDIELFRALQKGQAAALGALYDRYVKLVYTIAIKLLENRQEAEDLTQEIFLILWKKSSYDPNRGSLKRFLTTLTRSRAVDRLRSRGIRHRFFSRWRRTVTAAASPPDPVEQASLSERSRQVHSALDQLPENQRQVLELAYYEGLSQSEIAKRLEIPLGTVKYRARQGILKLRMSFKDWIDD